MRYQVILEIPATQDIAATFEWYEARRSGLGAEFMSAVGGAVDLLARDPERFQTTNAPLRWIKLRRFPYGLHYRIRGDIVSIMACLHFSQSPERWPGA